MARYALLLQPSANRVYSGASAALTQAELAVFSQSALDGRLADRDAALLANLSSAYALFGIEGGLLRPVELRPLDRFDDDLITIPKYPGKTNEQFTKLLLNVTLLSSAFSRSMLDRSFAVLDPLCGRGTTLSQALMYGYDATGVDLDGKDFDAYSA